jgi:hypothetical protein
MGAALTSRGRALDPAGAAKLHFVLRFAFGTTAAYIVCEYMDWEPAMLAPILAGVLLASLPVAPPLKVGLVLVIAMMLWAWLAFLLTTWFIHTPYLVFAISGVIMFLAFYGMAQAKAQLPLTLLLVCFAVIPVVTLTHSDPAGILPGVFVRAMALAVIFTWIAYAIWPRPSPKPQDPPFTGVENPAAVAVIATAIVLPVMLIYQLYAITDAIPVLLTTVLLVAKMEEDRTAATGIAKLLGNFLGGFVAVAAFYALQIVPALATLALITFLIGLVFGDEIVAGGKRGGNVLLAYNSTMVIFTLALMKGQSNAGTWGNRVFQFSIATTFAIGMMSLLLPLAQRRGASLVKKNDPPPALDGGPQST